MWKEEEPPLDRGGDRGGFGYGMEILGESKLGDGKKGRRQTGAKGRRRKIKKM